MPKPPKPKVLTAKLGKYKLAGFKIAKAKDSISEVASLPAIKLYSMAKMTTATTGTGTLTLGSAVSGYLSFAAAGVSNGEIVRYAIKDGSNFEIGYGTYTSSGTTLSRTVQVSSNSNSAINLSGTAEVYICASADDFKTTNPNFIFNPPYASQFTDQTVYGRSSSSTGLTVTDSAAGLQLVDGTSDATGFKTNLRAATIDSSFDFKAKIQLALGPANQGAGICIANNSGDCMMWMRSTVNGLALYNPTWRSAGWNDQSYGTQSQMKLWLRLTYNGTNLKYYAGEDGINWYEVYTNLAVATYCPSPTKYGFVVMRYSGSGAPPLTVPYFSSNELPAPSPGYMRN